jgi:hypothetical protein
MMKQWELFEKIPVGRTARIMRVSVNERGIFSLNQKAFDELDQAEYVELYFDKINKLIGVKPVKADSKFAYAVKQNGKAKSYLVRALAFLSYYNIKITGTMLFPEPILEDGMLVLDMTTATPVGREKPAPKKGQQSFVLGQSN